MSDVNLYDPDEAIDFCEKLSEDLEELERLVYNDELPDGAGDFAGEVKPKVEDMKDWIDMNSRVTDRMAKALEGMRGGVDRWLRRGR
jgi:hypothetical protein